MNRPERLPCPGLPGSCTRQAEAALAVRDTRGDLSGERPHRFQGGFNIGFAINDARRESYGLIRTWRWTCWARDCWMGSDGPASRAMVGAIAMSHNRYAPHRGRR